jgi:hypothetical protein
MNEKKRIKDLEQYIEDQINEFYPQLEVFQCKYPMGYVIRQIDPILFRLITVDLIDQQKKDGQLIEHNGEFYIPE